MSKTELVLDSMMISEILTEVDVSVKSYRKQLDEIVKRNESISSYDELIKSKDLMRLYGNAADDYTKICFIQTKLSESLIDMRSTKKVLLGGQTNIPPSVIKSCKYRIDNTIEQLGLFREAVTSAKNGIEARVRYYNSCAYTSYDKVIGAKC